MKKLLGFLITFIFGAIIGVLGTIFAYPFIFPPPQVNEKIENVDAKQLISEGMFVHLNRRDPIHFGRGKVEIYKDKKNNNELYLDEDFEVGPGPAFMVYLTDKVDIQSASDFKSAQKYKIGKLKSFKGSQVYPIPANVDITKVKSAVIWCESFGVLITSAKLGPPS